MIVDAKRKSDEKSKEVFATMDGKVVYHYSRGCTDSVAGLGARENGEIPVCCKEIVPFLSVLGYPGGFYEKDELGSIDISPTNCKCGNHVIVGRSIVGRDLATNARAGDIYILEISPGFSGALFIEPLLYFFETKGLLF